jgi:hypothetical protein
MHLKPNRRVKILFWLMVASAIIAVGFLFPSLPYFGVIKNILFGITALIGILLVVFTLLEKIEKLFKSFLILTGASAIGLFGGFFIGLLYYISRFFEYFYNLMLILCPIGLITGLIGCIVLFIKRRKILD